MNIFSISNTNILSGPSFMHSCMLNSIKMSQFASECSEALCSGLVDNMLCKNFNKFVGKMKVDERRWKNMKEKERRKGKFDERKYEKAKEKAKGIERSKSKFCNKIVCGIKCLLNKKWYDNRWNRNVEYWTRHQNDITFERWIRNSKSQIFGAQKKVINQNRSAGKEEKRKEEAERIWKERKRKMHSRRNRNRMRRKKKMRRREDEELKMTIKSK